MTRAGRIVRWLAAASLPLNGVAALLLTGVSILFFTRRRPAIRFSRLPLRWHLSAALLVGATCLAPTPYLPWATPAHLDPATDNLIITQDVSRWNRTLTTESRVMSPNAEETAACVAVPPLKALTHTVGIPEGSSTWTGSAYLRAGEAGVRSVGFRVGPPGGGGGEVTTELDETWRRYAVTVTAESRQTTMTMALFNRHAERPAVVCVWGPQLEAGSEATDRRTLVSRLESDAPGVSSRWWGAAVLL